MTRTSAASPATTTRVPTPRCSPRIAEANGGHQIAYGEDVYTARLQEVMKQHFGDQAEAFPVFNGTGANVTALTSAAAALGRRHLQPRPPTSTCDENGAPERVGGLKLLTVDTPDGKLTPELIDQEAWGWGDEHRAQPLAVSITQTTELGTAVHGRRDPRDRRPRARAGHGAAHGRRAASPTPPPRSACRFATFTTDAGVDILSFGGTKNGLLYGEAVVVLNPAASDGLLYLRKLTMQLASKMRFVSAQLIALLDDDLWLRSATPRQRDGGPPARRARGRLPTARPGSGSASRPRPTPCSPSCRPASPTGCASSFRFYDWDAADERGALDVPPSTRPRPTSTRSSRPSPRRSPRADPPPCRGAGDVCGYPLALACVSL